MRQLASIRRIDAIDPIPNADAIDVASIGGWKVVIKKGEFNVGDLCIYFEIDSFLPDVEQFSFLRDKKSLDGREGYRLRTVKLRKQLSQGLALPLGAFPQFAGILIEAGDDVTDLLNVVKWERPIPADLAGQVYGDFPGFIRRTDEERIQNIPLEVLWGWAETEFYETLKIDGSSMTVYVKDDNEYYLVDGTDEQMAHPIVHVGVCSRNLEWKENPHQASWKIALHYELKERLLKYMREYDHAIALQGELHGPGIQKNPLKLKSVDFKLFNIYDIRAGRYMSADEVEYTLNLLNAIHPGPSLEYVPWYGLKKLREFGMTYEEFLQRVDQFHDSQKATHGVTQEGFVYKSRCGTYSFKVISNQYLLEGGD